MREEGVGGGEQSGGDCEACSDDGGADEASEEVSGGDDAKCNLLACLLKETRESKEIRSSIGSSFTDTCGSSLTSSFFASSSFCFSSLFLFFASCSL